MKSPIALFDSGYGGLTILDSVRRLMPQYDYIYLGDNARAPYGTRSFDVVYKYTREAVVRLFDMGAPLIVLACNTASAKALRNIQQIDLPILDASRRVLGVIRPSVESVVSVTRSRVVGIMGTQGTVDSMSYPIEINKISPDIRVFQQACPMWVPLVENGEYESAGADYFVKKYVDELMSQSSDIDTVILACTHFPLLRKKIEEHLPQNITILSQGDIVAASLKDYLQRHADMDARLTKGGSVKFFTTENPTKFGSMAHLFFKGDIEISHLTT